MREIWQDYVDKVVPNMHNHWLGLAAHSIVDNRTGIYYGYPEQTMFWHVVNAASAGVAIVEYFAGQEISDLVDLRELLALVSIHDINKVLDPPKKRESDVTLAEVKLWWKELGLNEFCPSLSSDLKLVQQLVHSHHIFRSKNNLDNFLGDLRFTALLKMSALCDGLATIRDPREARFPRSPERSCYLLFTEDITQGKYELLYHQTNLVIGVLTNITNACLAKILSNEDGLCPLLYFTNGAVYIAPKGKFDDFWGDKGSRNKLKELAQAFYQKFTQTVETTKRLTGLEKGQPTPVEFSFFFKPEAVVNSVAMQMKSRLSGLRQKESELRKLEGKKDKTKSEESQFKRLQRDLDNYIKAISNKQIPTLLNSKDAREIGLIAKGKIDWLGLKAASDFCAFIVRLARALDLESDVETIIARHAQWPQPDFARIVVPKSGGVEYKSIAAILWWLVQKDDSSEQIQFSPAGSVVEQAQALSAVVSKDAILDLIDRITNDVISYFLKGGNDEVARWQKEIEKRRRRKLLDAEVFSDENILDDKALDVPIETSLLTELADILDEHLDINGHVSSIKDSYRDQTCNFCGRDCAGIRISAKMTLVDTPTYYSGYNYMTTTDKKGRIICPTCFFENVLRKVLYPLHNVGLYVFVFPEYLRTPLHSYVFKKQIIESFPKVAKGIEESEDISESEKEAFLRAIQHLLGSRPEDFDEAVLMPMFVVPVPSDDNLEGWIRRTKNTMVLRSAIGQKYILTSCFYPEIERMDDLKGAVELRGAHPLLAARLRDWTDTIRHQPILGLSETTLTVKESEEVMKLMRQVENVASGMKNGEKSYYGDRLSFAATYLWARKAKRKKGGSI